jgi:lipopolysaccharide heptosyltransferase I
VKTLVVRLSAIGDVVHTLPALAALKRRGHEVHWIIEPAARPLVEGNPAVARVVPAPPARIAAVGRVRACARELRKARYDTALDMQGLWKSAVWARAAGARHVAGFAGPWRREPLSEMLLGTRVHLAPEPPHVIDKNLALLRVLDIEAVGTREFPLPPGGEEERRVLAEIASRGWRDLAILNPGGGWASKLWPPSSYGAVAQGLAARGLTPVVTWGPGEEKLADEVVAASAGRAQRCFPTSLLEFAALARRARLTLAADTGPLHLACAVGAPVVGIFGPTDPARNGPFSPDDVVVRRLPLCAPCHRRRCWIHEGVMKAVPAAQVLAAADRRLARTVAVRTAPPG